MSKTLKDLCFLTGVLMPLLALILYFVVKQEDYKRAFFQSMWYGLVLLSVIAVVLSLNMCDPAIWGISDK